jgi:hypothetical protein
MTRREFITLLGGAAAWPLAARAQQPEKMLRVGALSAQPRTAPIWLAFERRMAELGYKRGTNFAFEFVQVDSMGDYERGYRELVARNVDILLATGPEIALKSARAATQTLPMVMLAIDYDPIAPWLCDKHRSPSQQPYRHVSPADRACGEACANPEGCVPGLTQRNRILGRNITRPMGRGANRCN